jgi:hypothetical protein
MWDRPNHREHGSAYGSMSHQRTDYVQILRVVYHQPPSSAAVTPGGGSGVSSPGGAATGSKLFYKTFTPSPLRRVPIPGGLGSGGGQADEGESAECTYEDLRQLEDKINAWLSYTGKCWLFRLDGATVKRCRVPVHRLTVHESRRAALVRCRAPASNAQY